MKTREEITTMKLIKFHVNVVIGGLTIFFFIASTAIGWALAEMNQRGITEQQIKDAAKNKSPDGTFSVIAPDGQRVMFREENGQIKAADDLNQGGMNVMVGLLNDARRENWDLVENALNNVPEDQRRTVARQFLDGAEDAGIDAKKIPGNIFRFAGMPVGGGLGDEDAAKVVAESGHLQFQQQYLPLIEAARSEGRVQSLDKNDPVVTNVINFLNTAAGLNAGPGMDALLKTVKEANFVMIQGETGGWAAYDHATNTVVLTTLDPGSMAHELTAGAGLMHADSLKVEAAMRNNRPGDLAEVASINPFSKKYGLQKFEYATQGLDAYVFDFDAYRASSEEVKDTKAKMVKIALARGQEVLGVANDQTDINKLLTDLRLRGIPVDQINLNSIEATNRRLAQLNGRFAGILHENKRAQLQLSNTGLLSFASDRDLQYVEDMWKSRKEVDGDA